MTVQVDWVRFVQDVLPGFELVLVTGQEDAPERATLRFELLRVGPSAPIPEDRECRILAECIRQMACFAALVNVLDWQGEQPAIYVELKFLDP